MLIEDRDELRKKIDDEVAALFECIRCLYSSRNTLAPVNSLPPEVLSHIFLLVRDESSNYSSTERKYLGWLSVTQISRNWRQVAIGCATLWTELPCNKHFLPLFLARSRSSPVSLSMKLTKQTVPFLYTALQSLPRLRTLHLPILTPLENLDMILEGLRLPALELIELEISSAYNFTWPENLFGGNAPRLRRLALQGISFPGYLPIFHQLTLLRFEEPPRRIPLATLLGAISQMPNLEGLAIYDHAGQETSNDDMDIASLSLSLPIVMPHLEEMYISSPGFERPLLFLSSLRFHESPALELRCELDGPDRIPNTFPRLIQALKATYQHGMTPFIKMRLGAESTDFHLVAWDSWSHVTCVVSFYCPDDEVDFQDYLRPWVEVSRGLPLTHLEALSLHGTGSAHFYNQLDRCPRLKSITAEDEDGDDGLIEVLLQNFEWHCDKMKGSMESDHDDDESNQHVDTCSEGESWDDIVLPHLEVIQFRDCIYDISNHRYWVQALIARKRHGYGPQKVVFDRCRGVTAERVGDLQNIIEVEWDGHEL